MTAMMKGSGGASSLVRLGEAFSGGAIPIKPNDGDEACEIARKNTQSAGYAHGLLYRFGIFRRASVRSSTPS